MRIEFRLNNEQVELDVPASTPLLAALRNQLAVFGVKHGCETGECGACTVLIDGEPVNSCVLLAAQAVGKDLQTIEVVGQHPELGWRRTEGLSPIQEAFIETGAIQCGYCTPAMVLAAQSLISNNPNPDEFEVREALSGILCRCTGYLKPVQAILRAAAVLRGETPEPIDGRIPAPAELFGPPNDGSPSMDVRGGGLELATRVMPRIKLAPEAESLRSVGTPARKVDAVKLVQGKPAFATAWAANRTQLFTGSPSINTVQAPHSPVSQPCLTPKIAN